MNGIACFKRKRGNVWKIRYNAPVIPGTSWPRKQKTETLIGCKSREEAKGALAARMAAVFDRTYRVTSLPPITVTAAIDAYAAARQGELRDGAGTVAALRNHVQRLLGKLYLPEVTTGVCEEYRRSRLGEGDAPATARKELRYLQGVFKQARIDGHNVGDPVADMSFKGINNVETRMPTRAQLQALVNAADKDTTFLRPLFYVLVATGLRISSALALRWDRLNELGLAVEQKGGSTVNTPMMERLWDELARWRPTSERIGKHGWVFPAMRKGMKGHLSRTSVQRFWPDLLKAAGVDYLTRHDMRRWVVTALKAIAGGDNKAIGQISGHSSSAMIDRYDQGANERARALMPRLSDLIPISEAGTKAIGPAPVVDTSATPMSDSVPPNDD